MRWFMFEGEPVTRNKSVRESCFFFGNIILRESACSITEEIIAYQPILPAGVMNIKLGNT